MLVYKYDENGIYQCPVILDDDDATIENTTKIEPPNFYRAKWTGTEWIEDMTQEEIDELNNQPRELTEIEKQQEIINALGQELTLLKLQIMMGGM